MQALLAVAWRFRKERLVSRRPQVLHEWMRASTPTLEAFTQLQRFCSLYDIGLATEYREQGPHHETRYSATITIITEGGEAVFQGSPVQGSKARAKQAAARSLLDLVNNYEVLGEDPSLAKEHVVASILEAQLKNPPVKDQKRLQRCVRQRHLGLGYLLTGDVADFTDWAERVEQLIGGASLELSDRMTTFYTACLSSGVHDQLPQLSRALGDLADWVDSLDLRSLPAITGEAHWRTMRAVNAVLQVTQQAEGQTLAETVNVWLAGHPALPSDASLTSDMDANPFHLSPKDSCALMQILSWVAEAVADAGGQVSLEVGVDKDVGLVLLDTHVTSPPDTMHPLPELMSEAVPSITCSHSGREIAIEIQRRAEHPPKGLARAGTVASELSGHGPATARAARLVEQLSSALGGLHQVLSSARQAGHSSRDSMLAEAQHHHETARDLGRRLRRVAALL